MTVRRQAEASREMEIDQRCHHQAGAKGVGTVAVTSPHQRGLAGSPLHGIRSHRM